MAPTPPEDWVLYADDPIIVKHSSIRQRKVEKTRPTRRTDGNDRNVRSTGPTMPPTPLGSSPAQSEREKKDDRDKPSNWQTHKDPQGPPTSGHLDPREMGGSRTSMRGSSSYRLPTPDLSDVDEDEMWACCCHRDDYKK
ncbi:MAG: hypothetical protein Q9166_000949 [cf. Caloplaca sp. 2 TL-2023]